MKRIVLAVALILAGTAGASAQGYGGYHGYGYGRGPVAVVPPRHPVFAPPPWRRWSHHPRFHRHHDWRLRRHW